jgi:hypothetical protein
METQTTEFKEKYAKPREFSQEFYQAFGKRVLDMLGSNPEFNASIEKLEKICDKYNDSVYGKEGWARKMMLEWAYTGVVLFSASTNKDSLKRLDDYVENIKKTLEHNKYDDPAFYIKEIFNGVFKPKGLL